MVDMDELQAAFEQGVQHFNAADLGAYSALLHDDIILFGPASPFAIEGKVLFEQRCQQIFTNYETYTFTPIKPQFRIIGSTGLVWSHHALTIKPKDGPMSMMFLCSTITFVKTDGKWLWISVHHARLPSGT